MMVLALVMMMMMIMSPLLQPHRPHRQWRQQRSRKASENHLMIILRMENVLHDTAAYLKGNLKLWRIWPEILKLVASWEGAGRVKISFAQKVMTVLPLWSSLRTVLLKKTKVTFARRVSAVLPSLTQRPPVGRGSSPPEAVAKGCSSYLPSWWWWWGGR